MAGIIKDFLTYAKSYEILIHSETRIIGIRDTLIGWTLIALSAILFQNSVHTIPASFNFLIQFLSATIILYIASLFKGKDFLKIQALSSNQLNDCKIQLSLNQRKKLLIIRGFLATGGYMAYTYSKISIGIIDNSAIFSADAIVYALLMYFFLNQKIGYIQWIGIFLSSLGISFIFLFDFKFTSITQALIGGSAGIISSIALALIILMNIVLVQHEPPLRIAFYQSLIGSILAIIVVITNLFFTTNLILYFPLDEIFYSIFSGITYAVALLFFFNAFLFTEPLIISVLGYSLTPLISFFSFVINHAFISRNDLLSSFLIILGGIIVIIKEYKNDKKNKKYKKNIMSQPTYVRSLKEKMKSLKEDFQSNKLDQYEYMSHRHEFNKLLFQFANELEDSNLQSIEILNHQVLFTIKPLNIKMECDGGCRSAPFEFLNFGQYEFTESKILFNLIQDCRVIFDIGAHIGWYSINFSKRCPKALIYSFEPIPHTFSFLEKNIALNNVTNIHASKLALLDKTGPQTFKYFQGGSALASIVNLIDHENIQTIECQSFRLDDIVNSFHLTRLDFIKCDVEGAELLTLKGGLNTISSYNPIIYIELYEEWCKKFGYTANDVLRLLTDMGYECFSVNNNKLEKHIEIPAVTENYNYFFLHRLKHAQLIQNLLKGDFS